MQQRWHQPLASERVAATDWFAVRVEAAECLADPVHEVVVNDRPFLNHPVGADYEAAAVHGGKQGEALVVTKALEDHGRAPSVCLPTSPPRVVAVMVALVDE